MPWVHILRCGDNTFYVGHPDNVASRLQRHSLGLAANHTALRLPVDLAYAEELSSTQAALKRERQLKRLSVEKKAALIVGDAQRSMQQEAAAKLGSIAPRVAVSRNAHG